MVQTNCSISWFTSGIVDYLHRCMTSFNLPSASGTLCAILVSSGTNVEMLSSAVRSLTKAMNYSKPSALPFACTMLCQSQNAKGLSKSNDLSKWERKLWSEWEAWPAGKSITSIDGASCNSVVRNVLLTFGFCFLFVMQNAGLQSCTFRWDC